jgi:hypothetical protein
VSQELLYIMERRRPHDVPEKPDELWLLLHGRHALPLPLVHRHDAFLEDQMHDWHWSDGKLYYHGASTPPCWVVLVYREKQ